MMQGPRRSQRLQAQRRLPDLPENAIDLIAAAAGWPVRLVCRRFRAAAPILNLRPQKPAALDMDAFLAAATKPTLLRPLTTLDLSNLTVDQADHQHVISSIAQEAATHCNALEQLDLGWLSGFDLSLLTLPGTRLRSTLRSLTLLPSEFSLPDDLAPLSLLASLKDLSLGLCKQPTHADEDESEDDEDGEGSPEPFQQLLAPVHSLTQLTALRLQAHYPFPLPAPQLVPIHFPHLRHLDLLQCAIKWDTTQFLHLEALTILTCFAVHHQWGIGDLDVDASQEEVRAANTSTCHTFFHRVANLPRLRTLTLHLSNDDAVHALPALFHDAPPSAMQEPPSAAEIAAAPGLRSLSLKLRVRGFSSLYRITQALHGSASALAHLSIDGGYSHIWGGAYEGSSLGLQCLVTGAPALRSLSLESIDFEHASNLEPLAELASSLTALTLLYLGDVRYEQPTFLTCLEQLQQLDINVDLEDMWAGTLAELPDRVDVQAEPV